ncbi:MAG TPA: sigma-70 family RNA polymerase sigma factor [Polyangiaceae bacterium]|nr:sigma-70 family RNA polymerase sigma factor [Polyangiaceae bacterium]
MADSTVSELHSAHAPFVWLTLQRAGVRPSDLEDALQEVFVVVHRRLPSYDPSSKITSWLFGISVKVAAQFRRRAHLRREHSVEELPEQQSSNRHSPEQIALDLEARQRLVRVLDTLEPRLRAVFVMFEIDGMSCSEIAAQLDVPVGTVHSRLHTARKAFAAAAQREHLRGEGRTR